MIQNTIKDCLIGKRGNFVDSDIAISLERFNLANELPEGITVSKYSLQNPVANTDWEYIKILDNSVFSPAANFFKKTREETGEGRYTNALPKTTEYYEFWKEEKRRCLKGYRVQNIYITGEHYFYLNYCLIDKRISDDQPKQLEFPDFALMDYYWFLELDLCESPVKYGYKASDKKGIIMAKARRKGWSFKNAAGLTWKYTFFKRSFNIIAAYLSDHAMTTFGYCLNMINFLDEHTPFRHGKLIKKEAQGHIESGYIQKSNGREYKKGYRSTIMVLTFQNSAYKSVGKSASRILFEEAGLFDNIETAYTMTEPLFRDGDHMIGIPIIFGTGGSMDKKTIGFSKMFYNPLNHGLKQYKNIYDDSAHGHCGYFVDEMWYRPGDVYIKEKKFQSVDENGNPNRWVAEVSLDRERLIKKAGNKKNYVDFLTQRCKTPAEAFMVPDGNVYPTAELYERLSRLKSDDHYKHIGIAGKLVFDEISSLSINGVRFAPDLNGDVDIPIYDFPADPNKDRTGCIVIYEAPILIDGETPKDMYIIGHDPYAINTDIGASLGASYVFLTPKYMKYGYNKIVASYIGRPPGGNSMNMYNTNLEKLSMYYGNAKIMFENTRGSVMEYFQKRKKIHLLMDEPGYVMSKVTGKKWQTSRIKGCAMEVPRMKQQGELYICDWLLEERGTNAEGKVIRNLDLIPDIGLLEELIKYNRDINCDRHAALMMCIIALEDNYNEFEEQQETNPKKGVLDFLKNNKKLFHR